MMGKGNFAEVSKHDTTAQIVERGFPVAEVSQRLGDSQHSLYGWRNKFAKSADASADDRDAEIRRLKWDLAQATEEREN